MLYNYVLAWACARAVHPRLPAPGAQPAFNPWLCSAKCTAVQHLKQLKPALPAARIFQRRRGRPNYVHTALPATCRHQQHNKTISSSRQWSLLLSARQDQAGLSASSKNGSKNRLDGPGRDPATMYFNTDFRRPFNQTLLYVTF